MPLILQVFIKINSLTGQIDVRLQSIVSFPQTIKYDGEACQSYVKPEKRKKEETYGNAMKTVSAL